MSANARAGGGLLHALRGMPLWPLAATLAVQTLATMALFSVPAAAPEIARELRVPGALSGVFVSIVYTVGIGSAVLSPGFVHRYGAVRVSQVVLVAVLGMLIAAAGGSMATLALGAIVLGLAYGAIAPASTHLLVPQTPPPVFNLVMSLRQIGVPLGGVLGALIVPPIVVAANWRTAMLAQLVPALLLLLLMEIPRRAWDSDRNPRHRLWTGVLLQPVRLLREDNRLRRLSFASFVFSGVQLCFIAFMTVQLTGIVRLGLVRAGMALAAYQIAGAVSRPIWGWVADRLLSPAQMLALLGFGMAAAALGSGWLGPSWPWAAILGLALLGGATASGYTGLAYAEYARLGGTRRTEATGLGTAVMFAGVTVFPSGFGAAITALGGYVVPDAVLAGLAAVAAVLLCAEPARG
ncbi:MAG TPA: MFS transporter [Acetobacteraceae bacterium]|nr:MFS transporter [Acetobacteraceae bacterium]